MKITPSLKLYFLAMMLFTGVATISVMSLFSVHYFLSGVDFSMSDMMKRQAKDQQVTDGQPVKIRGVVVASRWEDLPPQIQANINEQELVPGELMKSIDGNPFFSPPKAGFFAIKMQHGDQVRYVSSMFLSPHDLKNRPRKGSHFLYIFLTGLVGIIVFSLAPYLILRKVTNPVEKLKNWAKGLNKEQLSQPIPDFHYSELNTLADIVQSSLDSVQESLAREQQFLGYASHELRTPIAVTRTNTELLRKMMLKGLSTEKQLQVLDRIDRASVTMTDLTETLLWLNRQADKSIPLKPVAIGVLTKQLFEELGYLLKGKMVEISFETDDTIQQLPEALCRIVLTNLIRNALQHTCEGQVMVTQKNSLLTISNENLQSDYIKDELGFGLGLELTQRLVKHYGWHYKNVCTDNGHYVEIDFCTKA
ncbi:sensor histidine kinase [Shewanella youngdeokensis]|uniref:histidine kinase n=1 Tax=Shewanella youngdeokensis TaxID=2999068 RepID=A0ABZ0JV68_9GAMM|nr:HAMP domain-containing sensor histidine kinase [Shewanella sp. DAU334]